MSNRSLVVYGSMGDPHVVRVCHQLIEKKIKCFFIDIFEDFLWSQEIVGNFNRIKVKLTALDGGLEEVDIRSSLVWLRNKYIFPTIKNKKDQANYYRLVENEVFLKSIMDFYDIEHFNSMKYRFSADRKIIQLKYAQSLGLMTPATLVSNDKSDILAFMQKIPGKAIVKPLHSAHILPILGGEDGGSNIMVNQIDKAEIEDADTESIAAAPAQYQEYIEKGYEIRVLVTPCGCAAFKLDTQNSIKGATDSRRAHDENIFEPITLPSKLVEVLIKLINKLGLLYGIMDLIRTPDGDYYFLECNADGQWVWMEYKCEQSTATDLLAEAIRAKLGE